MRKPLTETHPQLSKEWHYKKMLLLSPIKLATEWRGKFGGSVKKRVMNGRQDYTIVLVEAKAVLIVRDKKLVRIIICKYCIQN